MSIESLVEVRTPGDKIVGDRVFPLTLTPVERDRPFSTERLCAIVQKHRDALLDRAMQHGAVLLRGFDVDAPEDFAAAVDALDLENMPYIGGAAVRTQVSGDRVLTANEAPPSEPIPFHHEMAQVPEPPNYILFCCSVPPTDGGETPILLSNQVYRFASDRYPEFLGRVEALGVRYTRVLPDQDDAASAIGRSWRSTYQAETREGAEARMREQGTSWEWLDGGNLRTITKTLPAIRVEPRTGQKTFFNSMIAAYDGWIDSRNDPKKSVQLGDGTPVDHEAMRGIAEHMWSACVAFQWHKGDILLVDNRLTMHARKPFTPPRRILASVAARARGARERAAG